MDLKINPRISAIEMLENYIKINNLSANSRIPSERNLCEMWKLNRTTLRSAVAHLVESGILYRKIGSGTYTTTPKIKRNLLGVNSLSSSIRDDEKDFTTKILFSEIIECNKQISKNLRIPLGRKTYEIIRLRTIDGLPCMIETTYIDSEKFPGFDKLDLEKSSFFSIIKNKYKMNMVSGEEKINVTYSLAEEAELLNIEQGMPMFYVEGYTENEQGERLEYYKSIFRSDMFRFTCVINKASD